MPLCGSLPGEGGPFAPALLLNPDTIVPLRWLDHRAGDFAARNRNLLVATPYDSAQQVRLVVWHGNIHSGDERLAEARTFDRWAAPAVPCALIGDFNATLSGPQWDVRDFNDVKLNPPHSRTKHIVFEHGRAQTRGPFRADTRSLDYLCGYWMRGRRDPRRLWLRRKPGYRDGGIGFYDVAELADERTPTQTMIPAMARAGRVPRAIDHALVNASMRDAYVPGSYRVHEPENLSEPDSDHKRIDFAVEL
jgi:hypothetical protein